MGIWPWQCTPTDLDNSTELRMEKICQAVTEIWVPQVWQPPAQPPARPPGPWRQYPSSPEGWGVKSVEHGLIICYLFLLWHFFFFFFAKMQHIIEVKIIPPNHVIKKNPHQNHLFILVLLHWIFIQNIHGPSWQICNTKFQNQGSFLWISVISVCDASSRFKHSFVTIIVPIYLFP